MQSHGVIGEGSQAAGAGPGRRAGAGTGPSANPRQFPPASVVIAPA
jgi:hypothetical protein